jgi:hypothetical protein
VPNIILNATFLYVKQFFNENKFLMQEIFSMQMIFQCKQFFNEKIFLVQEIFLCNFFFDLIFSMQAIFQ